MLIHRNVGSVVISLSLLGCCLNPAEEKQPLSIERHYERACESASRAIDSLLAHWENPRSSERMPTSQVIRAREAMNAIAPVCKDIDVVASLDPTTLARVDAAFGTIESAARNLPRLPAGN